MLVLHEAQKHLIGRWFHPIIKTEGNMHKPNIKYRVTLTGEEREVL